MMDQLKLYAGALTLFLIGVAFLALGHVAHADTQVTTRSTFPYGIVSTKETIACNGGVSPCTVTATNTVILNANQSRSTAQICNQGTVVIQCCFNATTCAGASAYDFAISTGGGTDDGKGSCQTLGGQTGRLWQGPVTCAGAAGGKVSAYAY